MLKDIYDKYIRKYTKLLMLLCGFLILSSISFYFIYQHLSNANSKTQPKEEIAIKESTTKEVAPTPSEYHVDIKGAVANPNVYKLVEGARIIDAISLAGGLTKDADTSILNLSKKVTDEMVIIIYTKNELKTFQKNGQSITKVIQNVEKSRTCPDTAINAACINQNKAEATTKVSLNSATKEQLMTLSGIGESKAQNIINYRTTNGPFQKIDDIKSISGIGDSIFDKIKDNITI